MQGSVKHMLRMTGWHDKRVLYIGDSMYSDWKEPAISYGYIRLPWSMNTNTT